MKTRFCPSPTGLMHLGNARTALFNALVAQNSGQPFLLRIEDTDAERSKQEYAEQLMQDMLWLGMAWQEGPDCEGHKAGGEQGPYYQSKREQIYHNYYQKLQQDGLAYPCFCSEAQLKLTRKRQLAAGEPPRYPGTCAHLTQEEIQKRLDQGLKPALRFRVEKNKTVEYEDLVRGKAKFQTNDLGDFIIQKTDGSASFMFCNAVDDALMGTQLVMRGEDHLTNTPRQYLILDALGLPKPKVGHISIITGLDGKPLSKRNGSRSIDDLRQAGYLPLAIVNYMARLGHTYENPEGMSWAQLAENFKLTRLVKGAAKFDPVQLDVWQKWAVMQTQPEVLWQWMQSEVESLLPSDIAPLDFVQAIKGNLTFVSDAVELANALFDDKTLSEEAQAVVNSAGAEFYQYASSALKDCDSWKPWCNAVKETTGAKGKGLFQPLRVALTGQLHGPEMAGLFDLLGKARIASKLQKL